ncbi:hypothetical protein ppKF707_2367 [Metapseudomonas furukawaii]|uniref:Uncharacterized protein n=1 Tax=Metapseudomonas furukawaii TaxID=1149133 RepID=A0AAD1FEN3_METFU|nr:hypothetical protein ppKF707_2367 [Pseudomonas furukawaii]BAU73406.1 hypothetical protein KF707C_17180 [Pseudomonas furukawaii]
MHRGNSGSSATTPPVLPVVRPAANRRLSTGRGNASPFAIRSGKSAHSAARCGPQRAHPLSPVDT